MNLSDIFPNARQADENAAVIFDQEEPIGQPTDLVLPRRRWFARLRARREDRAVPRRTAPNEL